MPNPPRPDLVHKAICAGTLGHIEFNNAYYQRVRADSEMSDFPPQRVRQLLRNFVLQGNQLDTRDQGFELWLNEDPDNPYWYRAVIPVPEFPKGLFVEVKLLDDDETEPWVQIVNSHKQP